MAVSIEKCEKIFVSLFQFIKSPVIFTSHTCTRRHARTQHKSEMEITGRFCPKNSTISTTTVVADTMSAEKVIRTMGATVQNYSAKLRSKRWFLMNFQAFSLLYFLFFFWHSSWCFWSFVLYSSTEFYRNNSFIHSFLPLESLNAIWLNVRKIDD